MDVSKSPSPGVMASVKLGRPVREGLVCFTSLETALMVRSKGLDRDSREPAGGRCSHCTESMLRSGEGERGAAAEARLS